MGESRVQYFEVARDIIDKEGGKVTFELIEKIGPAYGNEILKKLTSSNRFLFVDTDEEITGLFSDHYFQKVPEFALWIDSPNAFDLYTFPDTDISYV